MSESKFKVGNRVRVFTWDMNDPESDGTFDGEVRRISAGGMLEVSHPEFDDCWVHPRQCRKLVKKERRRVWVVFREDYDDVEYTATAEIGIASRDKARAVEFIEVRRRK